jgi:asparagine synthase (glutamine-hydrolysing)
LRLTPREVAYGFAYGESDFLGPFPRIVTGSPLAAMEKAVLPALRRPPCVVSFSGGRDSSVVLAVAARAARREGLALPIPVTQRFRNAPRAVESEWQELVIRHLGLPEWERVDAGSEFGFVGPVAARTLQRHGLLWPPNCHLHAPMLERASGGSLLTGLDGDTVLGGWPWVRLGSVLGGRARPEPRDLLRLARASTPGPMRRWVDQRRHFKTPAATWLRPGERGAYVAAWVRALDEPLRWNARVAALARKRYLAVAFASFQALADDTATLILHPFLDPGFLGALARSGGASGWGDRTATTTALFGEILPRETVTRASKATFDDVSWSESSRDFARSWNGGGVDEGLVDPDALRAEWLKDTPHFGTATLLQSVWLHTNQQATTATSPSAAPPAEVEARG